MTSPPISRLSEGLSDEDIEATIGHIGEPAHSQLEKLEEEDSPAGSSLEREVQALLDENDKSCFLVKIAEDDPELPMNWPTNYKLQLTMIYGITTFSAQFNSSIMAPVYGQIMEKFHVSRTVAMLPTSLYIFGIAFGPIFFAPLSEVYGRKIGVLLPFFVSILFTVAAGASTRIESVLITRFFAGLFAAAPVVSSGGVLSDIWHASVRGNSLVLYALFVVLGPTLGSIIGSVIEVKAPWQWSCWVAALVMGVILAGDLLIVNESYGPVLSMRRARVKRRETGNWLYHAKHEEWELTLREFLTVHLMRPLAMFRTPIVFFIVSYASFVFGVFYLFVTSAAGTFHEVRGWKTIPSSLSYIAMFLGTLTGSSVNLLGSKRYARLVMANGGNSLPEERLYPMMMVSWLLPAGLFVFGWTQRASVHWIVPLIGMSMFSCGFFVIFQGCINYLVDTYTRYAASAIAANTFARSLCAASFPLFGYMLFDNLGVDWGASLLAFISLGMLPIPFVFYRYGAQIRKRNPYAHLVS